MKNFTAPVLFLVVINSFFTTDSLLSKDVSRKFFVVEASCKPRSVFNRVVKEGSTFVSIINTVV